MLLFVGSDFIGCVVFGCCIQGSYPTSTNQLQFSWHQQFEVIAPQFPQRLTCTVGLACSDSQWQPAYSPVPQVRMQPGNKCCNSLRLNEQIRMNQSVWKSRGWFMGKVNATKTSQMTISFKDGLFKSTYHLPNHGWSSGKNDCKHWIVCVIIDVNKTPLSSRVASTQQLQTSNIQDMTSTRPSRYMVSGLNGRREMAGGCGSPCLGKASVGFLECLGNGPQEPMMKPFVSSVFWVCSMSIYV